MKKKTDTQVSYDPHEGVTFENASVQQTIFESELTTRGIKFFKKESISLTAIPYSDYSFLPNDLDAVKAILENIYKDRTIVPDTKAQVAFDIFGKWFSRIFIFSIIIAVILVVISYYKTRNDDEKWNQLEKRYHTKP